MHGARQVKPHRMPELRDKMIEWARNILAHKNQYVILDTETTGLNKNDVIIQIAITDLDGNELLNSLVRPTKRKRMSAEATAIHGITMKDLANAPTFAELVPQIRKIVVGKKALIYNAEFDLKLIDQTTDQDNCGYPGVTAICVMLTYSTFVGQWSDYHCDFTYQRLRGGDHSAIGDCRATIRVIHEMAEAELFNPRPQLATAKPAGEPELSNPRPQLAAEPTSNENAGMGNKKPWWMFWGRG
jgi:DNA polymerase III subunit epsilon